MKMHRNLFEALCAFENIHRAYLKARRCRKYKDETLRFNRNLENNLASLREELLNGSYRHGGYSQFSVYDSKRRLIKVAPFKDRVVHHVLCNLIEPIFDQGFIFDSYACRKGKGTHNAVWRLEKFLRSARSKAADGIVYCLKCDISKYFDSVDHKILIQIIRRKIGDKKAMVLIEKIVHSTHSSEGKGLPIGNLTSQLFANIYLNELDQYVKHKLGCRRYIRYMDDFLILDSDKKRLGDCRNNIADFLNKRLKLEMHLSKTDIFPIDNGIEFLGYIIYMGHRLLRKSTVKRFCRRMRRYIKKARLGLMGKEKLNQAMESWLSYSCHADSWQLRRRIEQDLGLKFRK